MPQVNCVDENGFTPLHTAAVAGSPDAIRALLEVGADVAALDGECYTPLHRLVWAIPSQSMRGYVEGAAILVRTSADPRAVNAFGESAQSLAAGRGLYELQRMFKRAVEVQQRGPAQSTQPSTPTAKDSKHANVV